MTLWYETGTVDKWKFTGYERDSGTGETGLDYANFRYYSSVQGRFMSVDLLGGSTSVPQSLNRFAYVLNDPINLTDPMGLSIQCHYEQVNIVVNGETQQGEEKFVCAFVDDPPPDSGWGVGDGGGIPGDPCFGLPCGDGSGGAEVSRPLRTS